MAMKASHAYRTMSSGGNVVLRDVKTVSAKKRIDPRVIELRAILLLERNFSGAGGQSVGGKLEGNHSMLKECACPLPVTKSRFIVGVDATAKLPIFPFPRHLPIEEREDAAANVVGVTVRVEAKVDDVGLEVVLEVEWVKWSKTMQQ